MPAAYRVRTPRLLIRCWSPEDAEIAGPAVAGSLAHLRAWLPWAMSEPVSLDDRVERFRQFRAHFDLGMDFIYGIFDHDEREAIGGIGLHQRIGPNALEIGYWVRAERVRQGIASEAAAALTRVALEVHTVGRVEIHCDPANVASAGVPRTLGYTHDATLRRRTRSPQGQERDTMIWSMFRDELPKTRAGAISIEARDAAGRVLLASERAT